MKRQITFIIISVLILSSCTKTIDIKKGSIANTDTLSFRSQILRSGEYNDSLVHPGSVRFKISTNPTPVNPREIIRRYKRN